MNQYKSSSDIKNTAREKLSGKYGSAMLVSPVLPTFFSFATLFTIFMLVLMPYTMVSIIANNAEVNEPVLYIITSIITLLSEIFLGVFKSGVALFNLNIACGKKHSVSDLFFGFRWQFKKSLALSAITISLNMLFMLPYYIFYFLGTYYYETKWIILALITYIAGYVLYMPLKLALSQCFLLLLDFPQYSVKQIIRLSIHVMKGHKKRLLYIWLSFIPLELLNLLSLNIGSLWLIPYQNMTYTLFFLDLMKPKQDPEQ